MEVFSLFADNLLLNVMNEKYRILPFLFDENRLLDFRKEFIDKNTEYDKYIDDWFNLPSELRL